MVSKQKLIRAINVYKRLRFLMEWATVERINSTNSVEWSKRYARYNCISLRANVIEQYIKKGIEDEIE